MATRFRKHTTRKMRKSKALKTRKQKGAGIYRILPNWMKNEKRKKYENVTSMVENLLKEGKSIDRETKKEALREIRHLYYSGEFELNKGQKEKVLELMVGLDNL
jgi:hypothetical protein